MKAHRVQICIVKTYDFNVSAEDFDDAELKALAQFADERKRNNLNQYQTEEEEYVFDIFEL